MVRHRRPVFAGNRFLGQFTVQMHLQKLRVGQRFRCRLEQRETLVPIAFGLQDRNERRARPAIARTAQHLSVRRFGAIQKTRPMVVERQLRDHLVTLLRRQVGSRRQRPMNRECPLVLTAFAHQRRQRKLQFDRSRVEFGRSK
ncbi:hypothetical protein [Hydrogenophilus thermoluteolus]|uniref:hypothetical protein n=1 Tax=Hydrogenophilus thermoluteolus TaxID=297 RepID=UPI003F67E034